MFTLTGHRRAVRAVAFAPGPEPLLASAGDDQTILLHDPLERRELGVMECRHDGLLCLDFAPDGRSLAAGGRAGSLTVWDVASRTRPLGTARCIGPVVRVAFTADGRALLAGLRTQRYGGEEGRLVCWNLQPSHPVMPLGWDGDLESVAVAPARDLLAIAGQHRGVELYEVGRARQEPVLWLPSRVRSLCFSPGDARRLAAAGGRVVQLYDTDQRQPAVTCKGHRGDIHTVAFSPDGQLLLSGGMDRSVRLWEVASGRQLASWDWQLGTINAVAFSSDGMLAAAAGDKPTIVVWDIDA